MCVCWWTKDSSWVTIKGMAPVKIVTLLKPDTPWVVAAFSILPDGRIAGLTHVLVRRHSVVHAECSAAQLSPDGQKALRQWVLQERSCFLTKCALCCLLTYRNALNQTSAANTMASFAETWECTTAPRKSDSTTGDKVHVSAKRLYSMPLGSHWELQVVTFPLLPISPHSNPGRPLVQQQLAFTYCQLVVACLSIEKFPGFWVCVASPIYNT